MTKRMTRSFSLAALLLFVVTSVVTFARFGSLAQVTSDPDIFANDLALKDLANYKQWTRVNEKPKRSNNFLIDGTGG